MILIGATEQEGRGYECVTPVRAGPSGRCRLRVKEEDGSDLQSEQVIHSADDDVDGGGAACLSPQVVLKI